VSSRDLAGNPAGNLAEELMELMRRGVHESLSDEEFNEFALRVFHFQCHTNHAYAGFVARRGVDPEKVETWETVPFLPARAFKTARLLSGEPSEVEVVFRTSGTTGGRQARGEHHVLSRTLYRESLLPNFVAHLLPEFLPLAPLTGDLSTEQRAITIFCLLPSPDTAPDSSLSFMMGEVLNTLGTEASGFFVNQGGEINVDAFLGALTDASAGSQQVLLAGTAFAFVGWMETAERRGFRFALPTGSRIMETGGYKGRSTELSRAALYGRLSSVFGVDEGFIVNEYGMTELLSQFYEPHLAGGREGAEAPPTEVPDLASRYHRGPPWVRTQVLDPMTLKPKVSGEAGVLAHMDLANLGSVAPILTEDLGREVPGGFQLVGRFPGSEPRGCSLAMEDFLASRGVDT